MLLRKESNGKRYIDQFLKEGDVGDTRADPPDGLRISEGADNLHALHGHFEDFRTSHSVTYAQTPSRAGKFRHEFNNELQTFMCRRLWTP